MKIGAISVAVIALACFFVFPGSYPGLVSAADKIVSISAKPEAVQIDLARTAMVIVDMQNAFASKGGMFDIIGRDVSAAKPVIKSIRKTAEAARAAGAKVIYLVHEYAPDLSDAGGPNSPNWYKEIGLVTTLKSPQHKDKCLMRGTWGAAIVDELKPQPGDIVIPKSRYSGFRGTNLDVVLKTFNIKYLVFTGIATNICVESTLRDGYFLDYWPILLSDATSHGGPPITQQATLWNVETRFGWVTTSDDFIKAISAR